MKHRATGNPFFLSELFPKLAKQRKFRPLIHVEGGGVMLLSRAQQNVALGLAVIVNNAVRFLKTDDRGYNSAREFIGIGGRISFDPELGGGPTVVQFQRPKPFDFSIPDEMFPNFPKRA